MHAVHSTVVVYNHRTI